jgi:hypothetical protein
VLIYTGSGLMGREVLNIRSSDSVVITGAHSGTLGEFAIAYDEGKLIGVLAGSGSVADRVDELVRVCAKTTGAAVLSDDDPERLLDQLIDHYVTRHATRPNCSCTPVRAADAALLPTSSVSSVPSVPSVSPASPITASGELVPQTSSAQATGEPAPAVSLNVDGEVS